jgi:hypothetical protein
MKKIKNYFKEENFWNLITKLLIIIVFVLIVIIIYLSFKLIGY